MTAKYDLYSHIEFQTLAISAEWDATNKSYTIATRNLLSGEVTTSSAEILISALGILEVPNIPEFPGISSFKGQMFHSAAWDHQVDLQNKRVAVVGNGASA